eukprot:gene5431-5664_t
MAEQFGWSKQFCGSVLSAFFAGYGATQVLGGQLSDKYGGSAVLAAGLAVWSLATALTPAAASAGTFAVLAARFLLGVGQGVAFPAIHALLAKRVPSKARSGAIGIIMACAHCGTAMGFGASPGIITSVGWAWTFYVFGAVALFFMEHCGMQLSQLGSFTLLPYLLQGAVGASAGLLADNLITKRGWRVRKVRVVMQVAGMMGPAVCLFAAAAPCSAHSPYVAAGLITVAMGLSALTCSGVSASHLDIAPRHAGVVFGVGNTAGTLAGLMAIPGIGLVLETTGSWSVAFGLAALHNVIGSLMWTLWVGDKPLPEDGGEPAALEPAKQQQQQPVLQNNVVPMPNFIIPSLQTEIKLKAA